MARSLPLRALVLLTLTACATAAPPAKRPELDIPEPYPSPIPPATSASARGAVSERAKASLERALDDFSRRSLSNRQASAKGSAMPMAQRLAWDSLLQSIDRFLADGVSARDSAEIIRTRATIEFELEADAAVYEQVPASLVEAVLARETQVGLRVARLNKAAEQRQEPAPEPERPARRSSPAIVLEVAGSFIWPVEPLIVNSLFGRRFHPIARKYREHTGIDLHATTGQDVFASASGTVTTARVEGGHGIQVTIDHGDG
jgi:murein DD-endopeptidase MepM/ murein hydrolase activator NlpD